MDNGYRRITKDEPQAYTTPTEVIIELAISATANAPDEWHDFNESQPIEELKEYLVCVQNHEGNCYPYVSVWHDGKWWKTSQMPMPFKITHFKEVEMPKIKTPEQLAAEKEAEDFQREIEMFQAYIDEESLGLWGEKPIKAVANYVQQRLTKKDEADD